MYQLRLLTSIVSDGMSIINAIRILLYMMSHFSFAAFQVFSVSSTFNVFTMICLGVNFFVLILFGVFHFFFQLFTCINFNIKFRKFNHISSNIFPFSFLFFLSSWYSNYTYIVHLMVTLYSEILFGFLHFPPPHWTAWKLRPERFCKHWLFIH